MRGYDYHYAVFSIEELEAVIEKAKKDRFPYVEIEYEHTHDYSEISRMVEDLEVRSQIDIIDEVLAREGIESDWFDGIRVAAFEAYWEKVSDTFKREFCEEQIAEVLDAGTRQFAEEWITEEFNPRRPSDNDRFRAFVEDCGFGHLLKGE